MKKWWNTKMRDYEELPAEVRAARKQIRISLYLLVIAIILSPTGVSILLTVPSIIYWRKGRTIHNKWNAYVADQQWVATIEQHRPQVAGASDGEGSSAMNRRPFPELEARFQVACNAALDECRALRPPYHPTVWISMSRQLGAAEAARRLVVTGDIQTGFDRLVQAGRPELTIEWALLDETWDPLFSEQHREASRWRLRQAGVEPPR